MRFVSDKNLWSAWGWRFTMKECAVGERDVSITGLPGSEGPQARSSAPRAPKPEGGRGRAPAVSKAMNGGG